jgi:gamma-glutamylcyclotransferase
MTDVGTITYFAYGSNMSPAVLTDIAPSAQVIGIGRLDDYRLAFTRRSTRWNAGVADVAECQTFTLYGVLYAIRTDELEKLDRKEGVPKAYQRAGIDVMVDGVLTHAMTYVVVKPQSNEIQPHPDYLKQIIDGARERKLPSPYLDFLSYLEEQFTAGTRDEGLLLAPTADRRFSAGEPLIRLNPADSTMMQHGRYGVLIRDGKQALGKIDVADSVSAGTCQADQALRACIEVGGQFCFGHRVKVLPCFGEVPRRTVIQPRGLTLPTYAISRNDAEKNYCVLHADRIKVLGLQEGEFARVFATKASSNVATSVEVKAITVRVFSGSASEVTRFAKKIPYPDRSEVYLDRDARQELGFPERGWVRTPVLIMPALSRALASRALFYGLTVLLGIGALFQVLQAFAPHWPPYVDAVVALALSFAITIVLSFIDLRSRFRY